MTILEGIEAVAAWLEDDAVCDMALMRPMRNPGSSPEPPDTVRPSVHRMYIPPAGLAESAEMWPGIMVALASGTDRIRSSERTMRYTLTLVVWNPGSWVDGELVPDAGGWRDLWNMADRVLRALKDTETIGDSMRIDYGEGIDYGPMVDGDGAIMDLYPLYAAHIDFTCKTMVPTQAMVERYL